MVLLKGNAKARTERSRAGKGSPIRSFMGSLRSQNGFNDVPIVHGFEGAAPLFEGPDPAECRSDIELATGHHGDDRFPHGPVVTKAALKSDVFLNEGVEAEVQGLRAPAHLADPTRWTHDLNGSLQGSRSSRCINHSIAA